MKLSPRLPSFPTPDGSDDQPVTVGWLKQWERNFYERFYEYHREIVEVTDPLEHRTGTWTPTITFATPGDLVAAYSTQQGFYLRFGRLMLVEFSLATSSFTWTTAAGALAMQGLPFIPNSNAVYSTVHKVEYNGITKAGFSEVSAVLSTASGSITFDIYGPGKTAVNVAATDMPSGGTVALVGSLLFRLT